ncbi:MAG: radical SAM protein [Candidatus Woesearchaeota archaeon]
MDSILGLPLVKYRNKYLVYLGSTKEIVEFDATQTKEHIAGELKNLLKHNSLQNPLTHLADADTSYIAFTLTKACNLKCVYCFIDANSEKTILTKETIIAILSDRIALNKKKYVLNFFGGEPSLCYPTIKSIVEYCKQFSDKEFSFSISTNGVFSQKFADFIIANKFIINFSWDGLYQSKNRPFVNGSSSVSNVEKTAAYLVKNNAFFKVRITMTAPMLKEYKKIIDYYAKFGVRFLHAEPILAAGRGKNNSFVCNPKEFSKTFVKMIKYGKTRGMTVFNLVYTHFLLETPITCPIFKDDFFVINPDGSVSKCFECSYANHPLSSTFIVGMFDQKKNKLQLSASKIAHIHTLYNKLLHCNSCSIKVACGGGCLDRALNMPASEPSRCKTPYSCELYFHLLEELIKYWYSEGKVNG